MPGQKSTGNPNVITKKRFAKEWLIFLAACSPGSLISLYVLCMDVRASYTKRVIRDDVLLGLCLSLGPFALVSLARSVIWAIRTLRSK